MITVYAILSELNGDIYVGMTMDADKRLTEHNAGKSKYTKSLRPWRTLYRECSRIGRQQEKEKNI